MKKTGTKLLFIVAIVAIVILTLGVFIFRSVLPGSQSVAPESGTQSFHEELYQLRNPYIGDASANGRILQALLPQEETGPYHMELETSEKPYVLRVIFEEMPESTNRLDELMHQQGLLILALIDNADTLQWAYPLQTGEEPVESVAGITKEDLYDALGVEEKEFELTPNVLLELLSL